jgi:hypothetical protein
MIYLKGNGMTIISRNDAASISSTLVNYIEGDNSCLDELLRGIKRLRRGQRVLCALNPEGSKKYMGGKSYNIMKVLDINGPRIVVGGDTGSHVLVTGEQLVGIR